MLIFLAVVAAIALVYFLIHSGGPVTPPSPEVVDPNPLDELPRPILPPDFTLPVLPVADPVDPPSAP